MSDSDPCLPHASPPTSTRTDARPLVASTADLAEYARGLARVADGLAALDPLPNPGRVEDELGVVPVRPGVDKDSVLGTFISAGRRGKS